MALQDVLVPAAVLGPAVAAGLWLALVRWPWPRRTVAALVWVAAHAAAWWVFWAAYRGDAPSWLAFDPDLLRATLAAIAGLAVTVVLPRVEVLPPGAAVPAVVAAGVGVAAVVGTAYASSLIVLALLVPVPTLAAAAAGADAMSRRGARGDGGAHRRDLRGVVGLALADAIVLAGLAVLLERSDTTVLGPVAGFDLGAALVLAGAAAKAGAVPWVAAWRMGATEGAGAPVVVVVRGQGAVLAAIAAFTVARVPVSEPIVVVFAALTLVAGLAALVAATSGGSLSALAGAAAAALFVPIGMGGGVGARAALLLLPAFVLAAGVAAAAGWPGRDDPNAPRPVWGWIGAVALAVAAASLAGLPPGGGFSGTWLTLSLATARALVEPWYFLVAGGVAVGLGVAVLAAVPAVRTARPRPAAALVSAAAALALLYAGAQPLRLGIGWLIRVERELALPEVLPSAGAPALPAVSGADLAWAALPAALVVAAVVAIGRGVRDPATTHVPLLTLRRPAWPRVVHRVRPAWVRGATVLRRLGAAYAVAAVIEAAAIAAAAWIVLRGVRLGFL